MDCGTHNLSCLDLQYSSSSSSSSPSFLQEPRGSDGVAPLKVTILPEDMTFGHINAMSVAVLSVLCLVAGVGNVTVLCSLLKHRRCGSRVNLFIMNLCVADLIVALVMMPLEIAWHATVQWMAGDFACRIMMFLRAFGPYLSSNILVVISLDRYLTIRKPLSLQSANKRSRIMIYLAWTVSVVYSLPQSVIFHLEKHPDHDWFFQCVTFNFFSSTRDEMVYNVFSLLAIYLFPLVVIVVSYSLILCIISNRTGKVTFHDSQGIGELEANEVQLTSRLKFMTHARRNLESQKPSGAAFTVSPGVDPSSRSPRRLTFALTSSARIIQQARSRTLKMTIVIVSVFIVCWTPYFVMSAWYWFHHSSASKVHPTLQKVLFLFAMSNSCVDPIVYGMFSTAFRKSTTTWFEKLKHRPNASQHHHNFK